MKTYRVTGSFQMGMNRSQPFAMECAVADEDEARERIWSDIGSRHGVVRRLIKIESIEEMDVEAVSDPRVRRRAREGA